MESKNNRNIFCTKTRATFLTALLLMIGTASFAQEMEKVNDTEVSEFNKWDADADQQWSQEEFHSFIGDVGLYGDWDRNYDGVYDDDELYTGFLNSWDTNKDGLISKDEYATGNTEWEREYRDSFDEWNANNDHFLDIQEYATAMNQTGVFGDWDADKDGTYSGDEFHNGIFNAYDRNNDGFLSNEEYIEIRSE